MKKKYVVSGLLALVLPLGIVAGCSTAEAQTVDEACGIILDGVESLDALGTDVSYDQILGEYNNINDQLKNTKVKDAWVDLLGASETIFKMATEMENVEPEDLSEEEYDTKLNEYMTAMDRMEPSMGNLDEVCNSAFTSETTEMEDPNLEGDIQMSGEEIGVGVYEEE